MATRPVDDDETLVRQLPPNTNPIWYDPNTEPPVNWAAFRPNPNDRDGLSMIRLRYRSEIWAAFRAERPEARMRLARLRPATLATLAVGAGFPELNFEPTPDSLDATHGEPFAHCVLPEINVDDYSSVPEIKKGIKKWARRVAGQITREDVRGPFPRPDGEPYRPDAVGT